MTSLIESTQIEEQKGIDNQSTSQINKVKNPLLHQLTPPTGYVYKWISIGLFANERDFHAAMNFLMEGNEGWEAVPHSRHPEMPEENGFIIYRNTLLAQRYAGPLLEGKVTYTWQEKALRAMMGLDNDRVKDIVHNVPK